MSCFSKERVGEMCLEKRRVTLYYNVKWNQSEKKWEKKVKRHNQPHNRHNEEDNVCMNPPKDFPYVAEHTCSVTHNSASS